MTFNPDHFIKNVIAMREKQIELRAAKGTNRFYIILSEVKVLQQHVDFMIQDFKDEQITQPKTLNQVMGELADKEDKDD